MGGGGGTENPGFPSRYVRVHRLSEIRWRPSWTCESEAWKRGAG